MILFGNIKIRIDKRLPSNLVAVQHDNGRLEMFRIVTQADRASTEWLTQEEVSATMLRIKSAWGMENYLLSLDGIECLQEMQQALVDGRISDAQEGLKRFQSVMEAFNERPNHHKVTSSQRPKSFPHL